MSLRVACCVLAWASIAGCGDDDGAVDAATRDAPAALDANQDGREAVDAALQAHGGSGFTEDTGLYEMYPLVRLLRTAPVNRELCLSFIGEKVMGLPRSY